MAKDIKFNIRLSVDGKQQLVGIQPHVKSRITPQELIPLPWDEKPKVGVLSRQEDEKRVQELLKRIKRD